MIHVPPEDSFLILCLRRRDQLRYSEEVSSFPFLHKYLFPRFRKRKGAINVLLLITPI